jgi:single-strand DNA-binding protein
MNNVSLVGRLTRDAELKYTTTGNGICEFALAVNERKKQGDDWVDVANYFDVTLFGRRGEALNQYLLKGKQVGISGRLQQQRWENKEGQKRSRVVVIANEIDLLGGRDDGRSNTLGGERQAKAAQRSDSADDQDEFPDGIPF